MGALSLKHGRLDNSCKHHSTLGVIHRRVLLAGWSIQALVDNRQNARLTSMWVGHTPSPLLLEGTSKSVIQAKYLHPILCACLCCKLHFTSSQCLPVSIIISYNSSTPATAMPLVVPAVAVAAGVATVAAAAPHLAAVIHPVLMEPGPGKHTGP